MSSKRQLVAAGIVAVAFIVGPAAAQLEPEGAAAYVTVTGGKGEVMRLDEAGVSQIGAFSVDTHRIEPGEGVRTGPDSTAVLVLPGFGAVVYLEASSELHLKEPADADNGIIAYPLLTRGRAAVIRQPDRDEWLVVAATGEGGAPAGYTLSKGASLVVELKDAQVTFRLRRGEALYFVGEVPPGKLIDPSGEPVDKSGVVVTQGQYVSTQVPPVPEEEAGPVAPSGFHEDMERFALAQSYRWLKNAERGDFTPVRGAARRAPEPLSVEIEPSLAFDQPRPVLAAPAPRLATTPVRTTLNPAQTLAESNVPATAVAGQRFRRTRIIGPRAATTGAIRINPAARSLIQLRRR